MITCGDKHKKGVCRQFSIQFEYFFYTSSASDHCDNFITCSHKSVAQQKATCHCCRGKLKRLTVSFRLSIQTKDADKSNNVNHDHIKAMGTAGIVVKEYYNTT